MNILIQCGDHYENQLRIKTLALILKENNCNPIILMYKKCYGGLFRELGINVVYLEDFINQYSNISGNLNKNDWLDINVKYQDILSIEGARRPDILWPGQLKKTYKDVYKTYHALMDIILNNKPEHIVIWNGQTGYVANCLRIISEKVYKVKTSFLERGLIKNSLFIDNKGVNGASSLSRDKINLDAYNLTDKDICDVVDYFGVNIDSGQDICLDFDKIKQVFFPLQVQRDTNILFYSKYTSMREVFLSFFKYFDDNVRFVIRPHPEEDPSEPINILHNSRVNVTTDGSVSDWVNNSDLIVTINSTVGLEALILGKPVVCLGGAIYSNVGITYSLNDLIFKSKKTIKYNNVIKYLSILLKRNILFPENDNNSEIVARAMGLKDISKIDFKEKDKIASKDILVFPLLDVNSKINLTYRKNKLDIDIFWIKNILDDIFEYDNLEYISALGDSVLSDKIVVIIVSDLNYTKPSGFYNYVIDIYGNFLEVL